MQLPSVRVRCDKLRLRRLKDKVDEARPWVNCHFRGGSCRQEEAFIDLGLSVRCERARSDRGVRRQAL